jgi:hypothetical protein
LSLASEVHDYGYKLQLQHKKIIKLHAYLEFLASHKGGVSSFVFKVKMVSIDAKFPSKSARLLQINLLACEKYVQQWHDYWHEWQRGPHVDFAEEGGHDEAGNVHGEVGNVVRSL